MSSDKAHAQDIGQDDARAQQAMSWYGFGSPVGLAILILSVALSVLCFRVTFFGLPG